MIKSRRMRWAGHVACMRENSNSYRTLWEKVKESDSVNVLVTYFKEQNGRAWTDFIWLKIWTIGGRL